MNTWQRLSLSFVVKLRSARLELRRRDLERQGRARGALATRLGLTSNPTVSYCFQTPPPGQADIPQPTPRWRFAPLPVIPVPVQALERWVRARVRQPCPGCLTWLGRGPQTAPALTLVMSASMASWACNSSALAPAPPGAPR